MYGNNLKAHTKKKVSIKDTRLPYTTPQFDLTLFELFKVIQMYRASKYFKGESVDVRQTDQQLGALVALTDDQHSSLSS